MNLGDLTHNLPNGTQYAAVAATIAAIYLATTFPNKKSDKKSPVNAPGRWPIIGHALWIFNEHAATVFAGLSHLPRMFYIDIFGWKLLACVGGDATKFLIRGEPSYVGPFSPTFWHELLGPKSLGTALGETHKALKAVLYKAFTKSAIISYTPVVAKWTHHFLAEAAADGKPIDMVEDSKVMMMKMALELEMGMATETSNVYETEVARLAHLVAEYAHGFQSLPVNIPGLSFNKAIKAREEIYTVVMKIIKERRKSVANGFVPEHMDILQYLITFEKEDGTLMDDEEIFDQFLLIIFATLDTSSCTFSLILYSIKHYATPQMMAHLKREVEDVFGESGTPLTVPITASTLSANSIPYVDAFIKEVMRLETVVAVGFRRITRDVEHNGVTVPAGTLCWLGTRLTHVDPAIYPNPQEFNPDRFLGSQYIDPTEATRFSSNLDAGDSSQFNYIPFGAGKRACLGQNLARIVLRSFLVMIVRDFDFEIVKEGKKAGFPFNSVPMQVKITEKIKEKPIPVTSFAA